MKQYNCIVHGRKRYRLRLNIGVDENGKPVYKNFFGTNRKDAERMRDEYLAKSTTADRTDSFGKLARFYTYNVLIHEPYAPSTIEQYERMYRIHISNCDIAMVRITDLTRPRLQAFVSSLASSGISPSALRHTGEYLRKLFNWMVREGYAENLMDGIIMPKKNLYHDKIMVFNDEEVHLILSTPSPYHLAYVLALTAGLRLGEILGLKFADFSNDSVSVSRELNEHHIIDSNGRRERQKVIRQTKTHSSIRTVPLTDYAKKALEEYDQTGEYVFTSRSGQFIDSANFRRSWQRHLKKCGIPYRKFHACRATFCTMLCKAGVPLETASKLMGHSDISVTAGFYRMISTDEMKNAVAQLDDFLGSGGNELATGEKQQEKKPVETV